MSRRDDLVKWEQDLVNAHQRIEIGVRFFSLVGPYRKLTDDNAEQWFAFHEKWETLDKDVYVALLALEWL